MNIAQANSVPLFDIMQRIGSVPAKEKTGSLYYLSPWRNEKTASFHINTPKNVWYDHGEGIGGDVVSFACTYLEKSNQSYQVSDGLKWIEKVHGTNVYYLPLKHKLGLTKEPPINPLSIKSIGTIKHIALIRYLESRRIPLAVAKNLFQEAWVLNKNTDKSFFALGLKNDDDGYELRNPFFKGCITPKTITFIRGSDPNSRTINAFEGSMDYLSIIARQNGKPFSGDTIILNSLSCLRHAYPYIRDCGYRMAYSWFDNDAAGLNATQLFDEFLKSEQDLRHQTMNPIYASHKDVNEWHVATLRP